MGHFYLLKITIMNIAVLALIGVASATDLKKHRKTYQTAEIDD